MILEHQARCNEEFLKIVEIKDVLLETLSSCQNSRKELDVAEKQFSTSLSILANYRKRKLVQNLLHNLNTIKTLVSYIGNVGTLYYYLSDFFLCEYCISYIDRLGQ